MTETEWKTINVKPEVKKRLDELKIHRNQSYNEVIKRLAGDSELPKVIGDKKCNTKNR